MHTPLRARGPWANGPIPVVGVVGGIGGGKSLVAAALASRGLQTLDADAIGHALLGQRPARDLVVRRFGSGILKPASADDDESGPQIDRAILGRIVFHDPAERKALEAILHPAMRKTFERAIRRAGRTATAGVVLDAAILYEAGWNDLCDAVLFVDAPREIRLARVAAARGWTAEDLDAREQAQAPLATKRDRADQVIVNDADPEVLQSAVVAWWSAFAPRQTPRGRPARPAGR